MSDIKNSSSSDKASLVQGGAVIVSNQKMDAQLPIAQLFGPSNHNARLAGNENPYGPSLAAQKAIADCASKTCYYADRAVYRLQDMIAERNGVTRSQVLLAAGTTEILCAAALAWGKSGSIVCPGLFWDASIQYAARKGVNCISTPMTSDMHIDLKAMASALNGDVSLVHIVNPNNPTGLALNPSALREFANKASDAGATLLVDEAYNELTDQPENASLMDLAAQGKNVVVTRTFSKIYGLAGLRVGYAISSEENIAKIRDYVTSFGGNVAGIAAAIACYNDLEFLQASRTVIQDGRECIAMEAKKLGLRVLPSQTNFLFVEVDDADRVHKIMAENNISIRGAFGKWKQYSRVSVGRPEEIQRYLDVLPRAIEC